MLSEIPWVWVQTFAVLFGLIWGSFLNVVIYRVPLGMSVVSPPSQCTSCHKPVRAFDNVPVLGYLFLRGKTRCCKARLSPRYPLVELAAGVLSLLIVEVLLAPEKATLGLAAAALVYGVNLTLVLGLLAAAMIDIDHMFLPDTVTLGGTALGLGTFFLRGQTFWESVIGAALGFAIVYVPFIWAYEKIRGFAGMGMGDAKLLMLAGAWFGWPGAIVVLCAGAVQGTVATLVLMATGGRIGEPDAVVREREDALAALESLEGEQRAELKKELARDPLMQEAGDGLSKMRLAFGPFLALATVEFLLFGKDAVVWLFSAPLDLGG